MIMGKLSFLSIFEWDVTKHRKRHIKNSVLCQNFIPEYKNESKYEIDRK